MRRHRHTALAALLAFILAGAGPPSAPALAAGRRGTVPPAGAAASAPPVAGSVLASVEALTFPSLVTSLSAGPGPGDVALGFADGSSEVLRDGRVTLRLGPRPAGAPPPRWVPGSDWVVYAEADGGTPSAGTRPAAGATPATTYVLSTPSGADQAALPGCITASALQVLDRAVAWWCGRVLSILQLPAGAAAVDPSSATPYEVGYPRITSPATFAVDPTLAMVAVNAGGQTSVYGLDGGQIQGSPAATGPVVALAWSPLGVLAAAGPQGVRVWQPGNTPSPGPPTLSLPLADHATQLQWLADGSGVLALDGPVGVLNAALPTFSVYLLPSPAVQGPAEPRDVLHGHLGYVLGFGAAGTLLWREEGVAARVWTEGTARAGPGPFSLYALSLKVPGAALPRGCGPRALSAPTGPADVPATPMPVSTPLPVYGSTALVPGLAARGRVLFASVLGTRNDPSLPSPPAYADTPVYALVATTDGGASWRLFPPPPDRSAPLGPMALSADGTTLAGLTGSALYVLDGASAQAARPDRPSWRAAPQSLAYSALAFDPAGGHLLVALGGPTHGHGNGTLAVSSDGGRTFRLVPLPVPVEGGAVAVDQGSAVVAVPGGGTAPVRLFQVSIPDGTVTPLHSPVPGARVFSLSVAPDRTLYLQTGGYLYAAPSAGGPWHRVPLPDAAGNGALAVAARALYYAPATTGVGPALWKGRLDGSHWTPVAVAGSPEFAWPTVDGADVWVPGDAGPVEVLPDGTSRVMANGIPAPVDRVASAAWDPLHLAAGYGNQVFVSTDGGRTFTERTPPGVAFPSTDFLGGMAWTPDGSCLEVWYRGLPLTTPEAVYLSGDAGRTWYHLPLPFGGTDVGPVEFPAGSGQWWAAAPGSRALYCTPPGEARWLALPLPADVPSAAFLASGGGGLWLAGYTGAGLWRVTFPQSAQPSGSPPGSAAAPAASSGEGQCSGTGLAGAAFQVDWGAGGPQFHVATDPYDASVVYADARRTVDGGAVWSRANGLPPYPIDLGGQMTFGPDQPGAVLAMAAGLVRDDGGAWRRVWSVPSPEDEAVDGVAPAGPGRYYVAVNGLGLIVVRLRAIAWHAPAVPAGQGDWTPPMPPVQPASGGQAQPPPITVPAASAPGTVYEATQFGAVDVSTDGGATFRPVGNVRCCPVPTWVGGFRVVSLLAASPADPRRLYAGTAAAGIMNEGVTLGIWTSADGGADWRRTTFPALNSQPPTAIAPGPTDPARVYAAAGGALYQSLDAGKHWAVLLPAADHVYSVAAPSAGEVLAGVPGAILVSSDGGARFGVSIALPKPTYAPEAVGLLGPAGPPSALLATASGDIYAATAEGLMFTADRGHQWTDVAQPVGDPAVTALAETPGGVIDVETPVGTFRYAPPPKAAGG